MVFSSASLSQGTRGFRYWMPMRPGWPVVKLNWFKKMCFTRNIPSSQRCTQILKKLLNYDVVHSSCIIVITRVYRSFVKESVSPLNAARNVKNDLHFHGSTTDFPAFHRDTSWSRDSRPIFSEGGGGFSP